MKAFFYALAAVLMLASAALALAPATLVDSRIATATAGLVRLDRATGTLWRGRGTLVDAQGTFAVPLAWSLHPWALARRELSLHLAPDPAGGRQPAGDVRYRDGVWSIERLVATIPAAMLPALAQSNAPVALGGDIRIDLPRLEVTRARYEGSGSLRWTAAAIALPMLPPLALGDLDVALGPRQSGIAGAIANRGGDVRVSGEIVADPTRTLLDLLLTAGPEAPAGVARMLTALGRSEGAGTRLRWQGPPLGP